MSYRLLEVISELVMDICWVTIMMVEYTYISK